MHASHQQQHLYDISNFVLSRALKHFEIENCLKFVWCPSLNYAFPQKIEGTEKNECNRKFKYSYLELHSWLAYSELKSGAFCKWCVVFAFYGENIEKKVFFTSGY